MENEKVIEGKKYKLKFRFVIILFLLIITGMLLWARFISTSGLEVKEYGVINNELPVNFHGTKIIHFSDIHYGTTIDENDLEEMVTTINDLKPDLVVFTGDLIDKSVNINKEIQEELGSILKDIDSKLGKFAVKGNHDYTTDDFEIIMEIADFTILDDSNQLVYYEDDIPIQIVGLPSSLQDRHDYDTAFAISEEHKDSYKILLTHEPDTVAVLDQFGVDLMLAGHSHGGQVRIPFFGAVIRPVGASEYFDEYYKVNDTDLYISSGLGTSELKFRFLNKPSINLYRLYNN